MDISKRRHSRAGGNPVAQLDPRQKHSGMTGI
jgi:hypothetical protein